MKLHQFGEDWTCDVCGYRWCGREECLRGLGDWLAKMLWWLRADCRKCDLRRKAINRWWWKITGR